MISLSALYHSAMRSVVRFLRSELSNVEEMMAERGFEIDHATLNRWVLHFAPLLEKRFRKYKRPVHGSWRMDRTYIKIKGNWRYLYRRFEALRH